MMIQCELHDITRASGTREVVYNCHIHWIIVTILTDRSSHCLSLREVWTEFLNKLNHLGWGNITEVIAQNRLEDSSSDI